MKEKPIQGEFPDLPKASKILQEVIRELEEKDKMKPKEDELAKKRKEIIESSPWADKNNTK